MKALNEVVRPARRRRLHLASLLATKVTMMKVNMLLADDGTEVLAALSAAFASEVYDVVIAKNGAKPYSGCENAVSISLCLISTCQ